MSDQEFTWGSNFNKIFDVVVTHGDYGKPRQRWEIAKGEIARKLQKMNVEDACDCLEHFQKYRLALRCRIGENKGFVVQYYALRDCLGLWVQKGKRNRVSYFVKFPNAHYAAAFLMDVCRISYKPGQRNRITYFFVNA